MTALMTSGGGRRRGRGQRLLYFFRTPPGVRVGRAPIDEDAIRLLEQYNPDIQFDWTQILKAPSATPKEQGRREERGRRDQQRPPASAASPQLPAPSSQPPAASFQLPVSSGSEFAGSETRDAVELPQAAEPFEPAKPAEPVEPVEPNEPAEAEEPEPLEAGSLELAADVEPRYARLGAEGLARLRARYAEVLARITERAIDESMKEQLRAKAERLNPDGWVTEDEVAEALERYESVFEELRPLVGRHPRPRRRRRV